VEARFVYDQPISSELRELVSDTETEVAAGFPPDVTGSPRAAHLPDYVAGRVGQKGQYAEIARGIYRQEYEQASRSPVGSVSASTPEALGKDAA
jgi:hypothetical protein